MSLDNFNDFQDYFMSSLGAEVSKPERDLISNELSRVFLERTEVEKLPFGFECLLLIGEKI